MERLKVLIIVTISFVIGIVSLPAQTTTTGSKPRSPGKIRLAQSSPNNRPNSPSNFGIECTYEQGRIEFEFPEDVDYLETRIERYGKLIWEKTISSEVPYAAIPDLKGEYVMECKDNQGRKFVGSLIFE